MDGNINEKEKCYFREEKCLNQIQKSTAIASKLVKHKHVVYCVSNTNIVVDFIS